MTEYIGELGSVRHAPGELTVTGQMPWLVTHPENVAAADALYALETDALYAYLKHLYEVGIRWERATRELQAMPSEGEEVSETKTGEIRWTTGAVGPLQRAIMRGGRVFAVADSERDAATVVGKLNSKGEVIAQLALKTLRRKIQNLRDEIASDASDVADVLIERRLGKLLEVIDMTDHPIGSAEQIVVNVVPVNPASGGYGDRVSALVSLGRTPIVVTLADGREVAVSARRANP